MAVSDPQAAAARGIATTPISAPVQNLREINRPFVARLLAPASHGSLWKSCQGPACGKRLTSTKQNETISSKIGD